MGGKDSTDGLSDKDQSAGISSQSGQAALLDDVEDRGCRVAGDVAVASVVDAGEVGGVGSVDI